MPVHKGRIVRARRLNGFPILLIETSASASGNVVEFGAIVIESIANIRGCPKGQVFVGEYLSHDADYPPENKIPGRGSIATMLNKATTRKHKCQVRNPIYEQTITAEENPIAYSTDEFRELLQGYAPVLISSPLLRISAPPGETSPWFPARCIVPAGGICRAVQQISFQPQALHASGHRDRCANRLPSTILLVRPSRRLILNLLPLTSCAMYRLGADAPTGVN